MSAAPGGGEPLHTVQLLGAPVLVWERTSIHVAELLREFALVAIGAGDGHVPDALLTLVADMRARFADVGAAQEAELEAALTAGERTHDFVYRVPAAAGEACRVLQDLLDQADEHCARGRELITLVSPPDQRRFRAWYLQEFGRQIAGEPPRPWDGPTA